MADQNPIETNLIQLFTHPENSERFSISAIIFEVNSVAEQKQAYLVSIFCFLL